MGGLLEVADVVRGDGTWTAGYEIDSVGCALRSETATICSPVVRSRISGDVEGDGSTYGLKAQIFPVITSINGRTVCSSGNEESIVRDALDAESEKAAGKALWGSIDAAAEVSLLATDVATVAAGPTSNATLAAVLTAFWDRATGVRHQDTVIHLGVGRLLEMFGEIEGSVLKNLGIQVATSPGYPSDGIAVTGPIRVRLGSDQVLQEHSYGTNRMTTEANRLAAIEFDPCIAVRVA